MPARPCAFCEIVAGRKPAHVVLDDDIALAFLDVRPLFPGHAPGAPQPRRDARRPPGHAARLLLLQAQRLSAVMEAPQGMGAAGSFVAMNNRISQSVPHLHTHVVPRNPKDGLRGFFWPWQVRGRRRGRGRRRSPAHRFLSARSGLKGAAATVIVAGTPSRSSGSPARFVVRSVTTSPLAAPATRARTATDPSSWWSCRRPGRRRSRREGSCSHECRHRGRRHGWARRSRTPARRGCGCEPGGRRAMLGAVAPHDSTVGKLLIAEPMLEDPNFDRTVVLMIEHTPEGARGRVEPAHRPRGRRRAGRVGLARRQPAGAVHGRPGGAERGPRPRPPPARRRS